MENMAERFWNTLKVWSQKPHVVNKRLSGVASIANWKCVSQFLSWQEIIEKHLVLIGLDEIELEKKMDGMKWSKSEHWSIEEHQENTCLASIRKCLPKQKSRHQTILELEIIDFKLKCAVYVPLSAPVEGEIEHLISPCPYAVVLGSSDIELNVFKSDIKGDWLLQNVLPKLRKWHAEMDEQHSAVESIRLVSLEAYNNLYQELKKKYVPNITKVWPECTDPQKFIHEDVAIASYLILIWRQEQEQLKLDSDYRQTFIDIGCGNGLLVYLLTSEGYPGKGIDIRARRIWSLYPPEIKLEVSTLIASEDTFFLEFDWLLGNHSDELTPWIAVMALQSSIKRQPERLPTRYWVLPCCPFSFWGKFQREKFNAANSSRYFEYLRFVGEIGRSCGYQVEEDRMRIPSTRRTCFVGSIQSKSESEWADLLKAKSSMIALSKEGVEETKFQPRSAVELIRNCTRVERSIQDSFINLTAKCLLDCGTRNQPGEWNSGGEINLTDLVTLVRQDFKDFDQLKSECGGIQTLLRNHSHIFVVQNKCVRFRSPKELSVEEWRNQQKHTKATKNKRSRLDTNARTDVKTRICWFFVNHPDGCPLNQDLCRYLH
ncbi:probable tRNA (uracil-O(2)-)-methyltransferase isoform X1 [Daphnia pulex]|uniref:probable tRNA (uracil-O(2)-)-methyltransferase isoform X1 n=1 Tax=Daphnia pulex TaxID=6669 RepID=UPI001EDD3BBE|nr:probable tRNA (uracil-O(2)-)-methyltransferase isoform X1 [Daphnia pulex]XP_046447801.1 probable tRNA (uracil-O(2)-)-methyltransferase isoform X1 [Daphnia pulex]